MDSLISDYSFDTQHDDSESTWEPRVVETARVLFCEHYQQLSQIARRVRRRHKSSDTFMTGDLLHEVYIKLGEQSEWSSPEHFYRAATLAMRHVVIDHAKHKCALKRGGDITNDLFDDEVAADNSTAGPQFVVEVARHLQALSSENPRLVQVLDCRYFTGLSEQETADLLSLSTRTVRRDWNQARAFLKARIDGVRLSA